jgi:hypothetical protein
VSITDHIPGLKGIGRHRAKTPAQLRRELDAALCGLSLMATEIDELRAGRNRLEAQLDEAGIELSGARHDLHIAGKEQERLHEALTAWESRWANAHPVTVPAPRDVRPDDDRPTAPQGIDVRPIRAVYPVTPIAETPAAPNATNPANIPAA